MNNIETEVMNINNKKHTTGIKPYRLIPAALLCLFAAVLSFSLTSCSEDADEGDSLVDATHATVTFTVNTRSMTDDEDGSSDENTISDYRIYFFKSTDKTYIDTFTPTKVSPSDDNATYTITGKLEDSLVEKLEDASTNNGSFTIVFLANWGSNYPTDDKLEESETTIEQICTSTDATTGVCNATYNAPTTFSSVNMPFYGVQTYTGQTFTKGQVNSLGTINLLRAMAKIEVVDITKKNTTTRAIFYPTIKSAKIYRYNPTGFCAPSEVYSQEDYIKDDTYGYYVSTLHLTGSNLSGSDNNNYNGNNVDEEIPSLDMYQYQDEDNMYYDEEDGEYYDTWVAYVPEYDNTTGATIYPCYIELELECNNGDGTGDTYNYDEALKEYGYDKVRIYFAEDGETSSETPTYYDIHRNKLYRFKVTLPLLEKIDQAGGKGAGWNWE